MQFMNIAFNAPKYRAYLEISIYKLQPIGEFKIVLLNVVKFKKNVGIANF